MKTDKIIEVGLDDSGCLYVQPQSTTFPYIYLEAMDVHWDDKRRVLRSPRQRALLDFTLPRWFQQILKAAKEQDCALVLTDKTKWFAVPDAQKKLILEWCASHVA
jgi:hypothetical protein